MKGLIDRVRASRFRDVARSASLANYAGCLPRFLQRWLIERSSLVDEHWLAASGVEGGKPAAALLLTTDALSATSPLLDLNWYRVRYGFRGTAAEALLHYIWIGDRLGLKPHPRFDAGAARRSAIRPVGPFETSLAHYLADWQSIAAPHPLFDQAYYLQANEDVREGKHNPLLHFVLHGQGEDRRPNAYFDPQWYRQTNADVANAGMPPALHFVMYGAIEGRNPGPEFDALGYRLQVGKAALGLLDPLSHYLTAGRSAGIHPTTRAIHANQLTESSQPIIEGAARVVDVIIPVYRGLEETKACIESALAVAGSNGYRLHIYNDESPEPAITEYLRRVAAVQSGITLVENETNLGFVGTVNRAMRAAMQRDDFDSVILLNSDTEVTGDWARRLRDHATRDEAVASVTAMSNNATICSYPHFGDNPLPADETPSEIDACAATANRGLSVELPTGVGFCMLITRRGLEQVGLFDEEAFGKGYGEEVDFCQRAIRAGMKNLLAMDVYVRHAGEVSFAASSKPGKLIAERIIKTRYPDYAADVATFVRSDPGLYARLRLTFARWRARGRDVHVLFTHALGGGTERRVQEAVAALPVTARAVVIRPAKAHSQRMVIECSHAEDGFRSEIEIARGADLAALLLAMGTRYVEIHHTLGFSDIVRQALALADLAFDFVVHDYYSACPQVTLTDANGQYCGERGQQQCEQCIAQRPIHGARDIRNWRIANEWLVLGAQELTAPSEDCAQRIGRYFGRTPGVRMHEEVPELAMPLPAASRRSGKRRVLILGALAPHKGRLLVLAAVEEAIKRALPLEFHLIGDPQGEVPKRLAASFTWTGRYEEAQLEDKILEAKGDVFLFASQAPETYSYTLSAAMRSGLPIVATRLGAFVERLANLPATHLVAPDIAPTELVDVLLAMAARNAGEAP